jgi:(2Fe-2S) ferredoxin
VTRVATGAEVRYRPSMPPRFERHLFICTNRRAPGHPRGSCAERGAEALRDAMKGELSSCLAAAASSGAAVDKGRFRVNGAGCLDQCEAGPAVVVYPDQTWYSVSTEEEAREVVRTHLVGGQPVDRLRMK